jgi:hypothetical protein
MAGSVTALLRLKLVDVAVESREACSAIAE